MLNRLLVQETSPSSSELQFNCGSAISSLCEGKTVTMDEAGWQLFMGELVASMTFLTSAMAQGSSAGGSLNMIKAMKALRCATNSIGDSGWNLMAAIYFLFKQFGEEKLIKD